MLLITRLRRLRDGERGSALIPVLGVMAVGLIVGALVSSSVVQGLTFSNATRSGIQSQAAADAGVAAARAGLFAGTCTVQPTSGTYSSTGSLNYSATVSRFVNGAWQAGCPAYLTPQVRIVSIGRATNAAGNPIGSPSRVEAIYNFLWPGVTPSGVAMYLYSGGVVQANSSLDLSESPGAGLVIKKGNFVCGKNNTVINGDVVVIGNVDLGTNSCAINGSAWVTGSMNLGNKGSVSGNLTAGSVTPNPPKSQVGGTYTQSSALPTAAPWSDVDYVPGDWIDSSGDPYQVITLSGSTCTQYGGNFGGFTGKPVIINAMGCPSGISGTNNTTFKLTSDVVIFAPKFSWGSINQLNFASADTTERRLWFITPDSVKDGQPTCSASEGDFAINNSFQIQAPIDAMLYTPCAFNGSNGFTWRGQIYSGTYSSVMNNPAFTFIPVGIAGHDLGTGTTTTVLTSPQPGSLVSNRNVAVAP
ncbi:hypothetical protein ACFPJ4_12595 [Lysinimonas soli]|uniref:Flp pilus-assembly TadG-like N-terminal domain-containing protein n=1 Tax=Lysinimonas soli TaxID=1074233 RepID=A0ABW0NSM5_9MICO